MSSGKKLPWKEEAWELLLSRIWDSRPEGKEFVIYTKKDIAPILEKYIKSGQGEIRIFHSGHVKLGAVKRRGVIEIPISRSEWVLVKKPFSIEFVEPNTKVVFSPQKKMTQGMLATLRQAFERRSVPGETPLLQIAKHVGVIADFYNLPLTGAMFTGGRQRADCYIVANNEQLDLSQAQIEIDGGFEWSNDVVLVEVKSSLKQTDFEINQALLPLLKWKKLIDDKIVHSMVLLCSLSSKKLTYHAYDMVQDDDLSPISMKIAKSKKYIINL